MNKTEIVASVAEKTGFSKKDSETALNALLDTIKQEVAAKNKVQIIGFGTFELRERAARKGKNPRTKEEIDIPASRLPVFKAGRGFKDITNK
jgi:DNA-binding protein HU-beta